MPEIKERPILFSGPMVRAILDGRKTVTRRPVKPQYLTQEWSVRPAAEPRHERHSHDWWLPSGTAPYAALPNCPYGRPGDRLWVRETFMDLRGTGVEHRPNPESPLQRYVYGADIKPGSSSDEARKDFGLKWKPSIHMPRPACRILLEVTDVRVERLQDITYEQAVAEGVYRTIPRVWTATDEGGACHKYPEHAFRDLWISTGGDWDANPWVWCIEFKRIKP